MDIEPAVLVPAYNRFDHLKKVLHSLEHDGYKNITVVLDGASNGTDKAIQEEIIRFVESTYTYIKIVHRHVNFGLAKSIVEAINLVFLEYEAVIVIEDDCQVLEGSYEYFINALTKYRTDNSVGAIAGYQYPGIKSEHMVAELVAIRRFCPWGWATWKDRWTDFTLDLSSQLRALAEKPFNVLGKDILEYASDNRFVNNNMEIWSLSFILHLYDKEMYTLYPLNSLIKNIGMDGSGVHSVSSDVFNHKEVVKNMFSKYDYSFDQDIELQIIEFLQQNSKMIYLLNSTSNV